MMYAGWLMRFCETVTAVTDLARKLLGWNFAESRRTIKART
jgi:hypothetical protein